MQKTLLAAILGEEGGITRIVSIFSAFQHFSLTWKNKEKKKETRREEVD